MADLLYSFVEDFWNVMGEMAPFLLFGFLMAGVLYVLISPRTVERHLGGKGMLSVVKAAIFGIPLPLCSCGVIPVAASLRRHGASRGATAAFIIATPQTGVDSILVTFSLLGGMFAVFRPLAALVSGMIGGWLVGSAGGAKDAEAPGPSGDQESLYAGEGSGARVLNALRYGFVSLPRDIAKPLIVGLLIAGAISAVVPDDYFAGLLGGGIGEMVLMMIVGIPLYVCATASVPVAAALMLKGISPGAALVFLMTGPATNAATVATVWKLMGRRNALVYLGTVAFTALASGLLLDYILATGSASFAAAAPWMLPAPVKIISSFALLAILTAALLPRLTRRARAPLSDAMKTAMINIQGMHCTHCVESVARALGECSGVESADVDLRGGRAVVHGHDFDVEALRRAVEELGYSAGVPNEADGTEHNEGR
ncbi:MAG: permease [Candidatus Brocadiae bacterium]|nr:permease [Candidatus Brocadiia bacterium]